MLQLLYVKKKKKTYKNEGAIPYIPVTKWYDTDHNNDFIIDEYEENSDEDFGRLKSGAPDIKSGGATTSPSSSSDLNILTTVDTNTVMTVKTTVKTR